VRATECWRGLRFTEFELCQIARIRYQSHPIRQAAPAPLSSANPGFDAVVFTPVSKREPRFRRAILG
jgi:hypothetical protein